MAASVMYTHPAKTPAELYAKLNEWQPNRTMEAVPANSPAELEVSAIEEAPPRCSGPAFARWRALADSCDMQTLVKLKLAALTTVQLYRPVALSAERDHLEASSCEQSAALAQNAYRRVTQQNVCYPRYPEHALSRRMPAS